MLPHLCRLLEHSPLMTTFLKTLFSVFFLLLPLCLSAQIGKNIVPNGGFENYGATPAASSARPLVTTDESESDNDNESDEDANDEDSEDNGDDNSVDDFDPYVKPQFWYVNSSLFSSRTKDAHSGNFALKVYPNGASFFTRDSEFNPYHLHVVGGATYRLTYWYKGENVKPNVQVTIDWLRGTSKVAQDTRTAAADLATNISDQWQKKELTFVAPQRVNRAGLAFYLNYDSEANAKRGFILIDDISLVMIAEPPSTAVLLPPQQLRVQPQQRELHLTWHAVAQPNAHYEVRANNQLVGTTSDTQFTLAHLPLNTRYTISVTTVVGEERSQQAATLSTKTSMLDRGIDEEDRIPQLYTLREVGTCPRRLPLYWKDLADEKAQITYEIDDVVAQPEGDFLVFPSPGEHALRITIVESPTRQWTLEYFLQVDK